MKYTIFYHPEIRKKDLPSIPENIKGRIRKAIESRLMADPERYGAPLRRGLRGYRKLRIGDYRVIYKLDRDTIKVLKIGHRKEVYRKIHPRVK